MESRPQPGDYPPTYEKYYAQLPATPIMELMAQQPVELLSLISGLSEEQASRAYAPGKWNTKQVLGHLIDTERIMLYRALSISRGEEQSLPGFDENTYVENGGFTARALANLIQEYELVRKASLAFFQNLDPAALLRRGKANNSSMTVNALFAFIPAHERHHLNLFKERYLPVW
jgi:uncharacterized damage-inducible protein DinB